MYLNVLYCTGIANAWGPTWLALEQTYNLERTRLAFFFLFRGIWRHHHAAHGNALFVDRRHLELLVTFSHCFAGDALEAPPQKDALLELAASPTIACVVQITALAHALANQRCRD